MSDWVHCNMCFNQPGKSSDRKFSLTNCGHVYCDVCIKDGTKDKCKMCGSSCTTIVLSAKMKPDVELFFSDPSDVAKKHLKQLVQVIDFQKNHRKRLSSYLREKAQRESSMLEQTQMSVAYIQELQRENSKLREENIYLKKLINDTGINATRGTVRGSTPGMNCARASPTSRQGNHTPYSRSPSCSGLVPFRHTPHNMRGSMMDSRSGAQNSPASLTPNPNRLSLRTPPSHGRMGTIPLTERTPTSLTPGATGSGHFLANLGFNLVSPGNQK